MAEALVGQIRAGDAASTLDPYLAEDVGQARGKRGFSRQRKAQGGTPAAGHLPYEGESKGCNCFSVPFQSGAAGLLG
jgi:hypothetical protein